MENKLNQNLQKMMTQVGATGISVADKEGTPVITKGNMDSRVANMGALIMDDARNMYPNAVKQNNPIIVMHSANGSKITVVNNHGETVTMHTK